MAHTIPINLEGGNLGERHKYLNSLVNEAYQNNEDFEAIKNTPEKSPIDRLFKIDLASKLKNVDYILQNLKDDDMLFVSRALKSKWLIEPNYESIMNPTFLEEHVFPEMVAPAVTKMHYWIYINLNDEVRSKQFFDYYRVRNFDLAIKFFVKCSKEDIQHEFDSIKTQVSTDYLRMVSEKNPQVIKMFFDSLANDDEMKRIYLYDENGYFQAIKHHLKTNPDMILDITERYFNKNNVNRFSAMHTKFIMKFHKDRFWKKPELYTAWILNTSALADSLNSEEAKELVLKLAQANYLMYLGWFTYKTVEPFVKRIKPEERAAFKKKVFVQKDVGKTAEAWPYETPEPPTIPIEYVNIFDDIEPTPSDYHSLRYKKINCKKFPRRIIKKKSGPRCENVIIESCDQGQTLLDKLFNEFRFSNFGQTLYELRKRIAAESSSKNREFMIFVLISKTGGRPESVALLLELLAGHVNEPVNVRAAIIRSLVKRAQIWRLPENSWKLLLQYGQGLGLDGKTPEAECVEGFHAVVIRSFLQNGTLELDVKNTFLRDVCNLIDYSLNESEKKVISTVLPKLLLEATVENKNDQNVAVRYLEHLIDTLKAYKIKISTYPTLIDTIIQFSKEPESRVNNIVLKLFDEKIARKELFLITSELINTNASYFNALKHDINVINAEKFASRYSNYAFQANYFCRKLSLYFGEDNGLAGKVLQELLTQKPFKSLGKLLAFFLKEQFLPYLEELESTDDKDKRILATAIHNNIHLVRPMLDLNVIGWKKAGAKQVSNKLINCRAIDVDNNVKELLKWKRTARTALALSKKTTYYTDTFIKFASMRPTTAIKCGLKLMKTEENNTDPMIWATIKPIIEGLDLIIPKRRYLLNTLENIDVMPTKFKPEFSTVIYKSLLKIDFYYAMPSLCHMEIVLPDVNVQYLEDFISKFLQDYFVAEKLTDDRKDMKCTSLHVRIFVKYLLLCKNEEEQKRKLEKCLDPFLKQMDQLRESNKIDLFKKYFNIIIRSLKYSKVFLSTEYISPLPVMEKIILWLQKSFSVAEDFLTFAQLHIVMLFYKAIQLAIQLSPEIFVDKKKRSTEGVVTVGNILGKFLASEVNNLQAQFFPSICKLYVHCIETFFNIINSNVATSEFLTSLVKGMFMEERGFKLGVYLLEEQRFRINDEHYKGLVKIMNSFDDTEAQFFASAFDY